MAPAASPTMAFESGDIVPDEPWARAGNPKLLIPLLPADEAGSDPAMVATWHEALSSAIAPDVPHDLFALWLYPAAGGAVLLGPAELAQDELAVPIAAPSISNEQTRLLEDIIRDVGYGSAACLPIRFGQRDVGLLLAADLRVGRYGPRELGALEDAARQLAPAFARLSRRWGMSLAHPASLEHAVGLVEQLGRAAAEAHTPREYARAVSAALDPTLPHERLELFVPGSSPDQIYRLGEHNVGPLWTDAALIVDRQDLDIAALLPNAQATAVNDTRRDRRWPRDAMSVLGTEELRSVLGVRLVLGGRAVGFLLLGSAGAEFYQPGDAERLAQIAPLIATRVDAFVQAWLLGALRAQLGQQQAVPAQLRRMSALLANSKNVTEALREFMAEATALLPFHRVRLALRLGDEDRVVLVVPGESRPLADLPLVPVTGTLLAQILSGEMPEASSGAAPEVDLLFPLRVAGQVIGVIVLTTDTPDAFTHAHRTLAQQVADLLAPHLELQRRAAVGAPLAPGWKRTPRL